MNDAVAAYTKFQTDLTAAKALEATAKAAWEAENDADKKATKKTAYDNAKAAVTTLDATGAAKKTAKDAAETAVTAWRTAEEARVAAAIAAQQDQVKAKRTEF